MEGVEDIPGVALHEGLAWNWDSFPDYLDTLDSRPRDMDLCAQLPHGALRVFVMGERAARLEPATETDIAAMRRLAEAAMRAGAIGFSTSRTLNHRSIKGEPTPSLRAEEQELMGIALGMRDAGSGVIEMISDFDQPDQATEFAMIRRLAEQSGRPLSLSLAQAHRAPDGWRTLLQRIDEAAADGVEIRAQVAPRAIGLLLGLQASLNPFCTLPTYKAIAEQSLAARVSAFRDAEFRQHLLAEAAEATGQRERGLNATQRLLNFTMMFRLGDPVNYEPPEAESLANLAARQGVDPAVLAYDLLLEDEGRQFLYVPFANYARYNLDACGEMIGAANTVMGLGDGGAHVGIIADASFPTYLLTHWGRDRPTGRFDLATLVKRQSADTARAVGLRDRGVLAPGMKADLNIIDFDKLALERPIMAFDLPAGGKRLLQKARGYRHTIVSGVETYRDGEATGALPGKLVRGPQSLCGGASK
jgi:N-acyl-D-aspartate/D-glutamate deacylase